MVEINLKNLARAVKGEEMMVKRAVARSINDVAFRSLKAIPERAARDMNFRKDPRRAMGFTRYLKATPRKLYADMPSKRGWLKFHLEEGIRRASGSYKVDGRPLMLIPVDRRFFTVTGRLRASARRGSYQVSRGRKAYLFHRRVSRAKRRRRGSPPDSKLIGVFVPYARTHVDTRPDAAINEVFVKRVDRSFKYHMGNELRRRRVR